MSQCRTCGKSWPSTTAACPDDGTTLGPPVQTPARGLTSTQGLALATASAAQVNIDQMSGDLIPGSRVGEYEIQGKLGEGGMGSVYAATHPVIGKKAAIKVISRALCTSTEAVERFIREARSVNQIGHPNIVDVFSFGLLPDGRCYFVMEWLQGEGLSARLKRERIPFIDAIEILDSIAKALEAAHEEGITHRDLKPDNIFLVKVRGERPLVKLLDFGIAKLAADDGSTEKTRMGTMMGTPLYISPEQARGIAVDHRTDIYALGVVAYVMLLGRPPFMAENAMDIIGKHLYEAPPPPEAIWPDVPPVLGRALHRMLAKNADERPTLEELRAVFAEVRGLFVGVRPPAAAGYPFAAATPAPFGTGAVVPIGSATPVPGAVVAPMTGAATPAAGISQSHSGMGPAGMSQTGLGRTGGTSPLAAGLATGESHPPMASPVTGTQPPVPGSSTQPPVATGTQPPMLSPVSAGPAEEGASRRRTVLMASFVGTLLLAGGAAAFFVLGGKGGGAATTQAGIAVPADPASKPEPTKPEDPAGGQGAVATPDAAPVAVKPPDAAPAIAVHTTPDAAPAAGTDPDPDDPTGSDTSNTAASPSGKTTLVLRLTPAATIRHNGEVVAENVSEHTMEFDKGGTFRFEFSAPGYPNETRALKLEDGQLREARVRLKKKSTGTPSSTKDGLIDPLKGLKKHR